MIFTDLREKEIENVLEDSDIGDFVPSDDDFGDPEYLPQIVRELASDSSSEDDEANEPNELEPDVSTSFIRGRSRGTSGRSSRGVPSRRRRQRVRHSVTPSTSGSTHAEWTQQEFHPSYPILAEPSYVPNDTDSFSKLDLFRQYIDDDLLNICVEKTNQTAVKLSGQSLNLTLSELKLYIGLSLIMASINYPILRMYWMERWKFVMISDQMSRNRYQQLRNSLKFVFDDDFTPEEKAKDKLYKVRPLINRVQKGCQQQNKSQNLSIDEMIIPFTGSCGIKQYCPGKPNPVGLKAFVLAKPNGVVCDFHIYQGTTTYPEYDNTSFGLAEKAILSLADQLVPGHVLYFDRYFSSQKLADELSSRGILCSGTLMKNRIPHGCQLKDDRSLKEEGRGSCHVLVRPDKKVAVTKWFDNKPVIFMSTLEAEEISDFCSRWCKSTKRYVTVLRPQVVREYNKNMGGVDLADRLLAVCPNRYKTNKWTQRLFSHMIDLCVSNAWLEYKISEIKKGTPKRKILMLREFKLQLGEDMIDEVNINNRPVEEFSDDNELENQPRKRGKPSVVPLPSKKRRTFEAKHLPNVDEKQSRCRSCHYNKTHFKCTTCNIYLCITKRRNCYYDFHNC